MRGLNIKRNVFATLLSVLVVLTLASAGEAAALPGANSGAFQMALGGMQLGQTVESSSTTAFALTADNGTSAAAIADGDGGVSTDTNGTAGTDTAASTDTNTAAGTDDAEKSSADALAAVSAATSALTSDAPSSSVSVAMSSAASASSSQELAAQSGEVDSPYDVWVGGVAVTATNKDNVLGDGLVVFTPADVTAGTPATLTLGDDKGVDVSIAGVAGLYHGAAIMSNHNLTIDIKNPTTLTGASCASGAVAGIYVEGSLILKDTYGSSLTVTAGDSSDGTAAGEDFSAGIYADGDVSISNVECTATGGGGTASSFGLFARGSLTMTGNYTELTCNGGAGTNTSVGIRAFGDMKVTSDIPIVARGADVAGGSSAGICAQSIDLSEWSPAIEAYGGAAKSSSGILMVAETSGATTGITLVDWSSITAQGGDATLESYGIRCANATDIVSVSGDSHIKATAGTVSAADGTSEGILGCLAYSVAAKCDPIVDASSGTANTSKALSTDPQISGDYRWLTDAVSSWQHGTANPYRYSGTERLVSLRSTNFPVWVERTQVTMANEDDVLGDGKVSFVPATGDSSLGTLSLDNALIDVSSSYYGPAIEAHGSLTISLTGDSKAVGGEGYDASIGVYTRASTGYDKTGDTLTVTGDGTLHVTSLPSDEYKDAATIRVGKNGRSPLVISGAAKIIAEAPTGMVNSHGVEAGDITLTGAASLIGVGGPAVFSAGIYGYGAISLGDTSKLAGYGVDSTKTVERGLPGASYGVRAEDSITVADAATFVAHSGAAYFGYSVGFLGGGTFVVTGGTLDIQSGVADTNFASNIAPDLSSYASYQWKTAEADPWTDSATAKYAYDSTQTYIQVAPIDYDVWVCGVRVNSVNKGNVLKGTANDGKVSYDPDTKMLILSGANLAGADGVDDGAGIYTTLDGLTIDVTGDNTVTGGAGSDATGTACGIEAPNLTITGTGNLNATAADMTAGSDTKSYGVLGNVTLKDSANAAFAGGKAATSAGLDGALVAEGSSHLTATGGAATAASYGLNCGSGAAPMLKDDASVTLTAGDAPTSNATNAALDLSGHNAYHWRISSADKWTNSTTAPYAFAASDAYVEVESGTVPVPTPPSSSTSTSTSTPVPTSTPNDVSGQDTGSQAKSLANTGDGSLTMPLALLVSALVATIVLVAFQLRRVNRRGEKRD